MPLATSALAPALAAAFVPDGVVALGAAVLVELEAEGGWLADDGGAA
jgi:hypothetical protein